MLRGKRSCLLGWWMGFLDRFRCSAIRKCWYFCHLYAQRQVFNPDSSVAWAMPYHTHSWPGSHQHRDHCPSNQSRVSRTLEWVLGSGGSPTTRSYGWKMRIGMPRTMAQVWSSILRKVSSQCPVVWNESADDLDSIDCTSAQRSQAVGRVWLPYSEGVGQSWTTVYLGPSAVASRSHWQVLLLIRSGKPLIYHTFPRIIWLGEDLKSDNIIIWSSHQKRCIQLQLGVIDFNIASL